MVEAEQSGLELLEEGLGIVDLGRAEGTAARIPVLSPSPTPQRPPFLVGALAASWHQPGGRH